MFLQTATGLWTEKLLTLCDEKTKEELEKLNLELSDLIKQNYELQF